MIYLDNAATTFPKPRGVVRAVSQSLKKYSANAGRGAHALALKSAEEIYKTRKKAGALFGVEPEKVAFAANATHALNTVIKGLFHRSDRVLVSDLEHNSVLRPVNDTCRYSVFETFEDDEKTLQSIDDMLSGAAAVIVTAASNVTGQTLPIARIRRLCSEKGALCIVDASQAAGTYGITADSFDFLCTAGHKGLFGPQGTGLIAVNCDRYVRPLTLGGSGSASFSLLQPSELPDRLEAGTLNLQGIVGLGAGIDYVNQNPNILIHEKTLVKRLAEGLSKLPRVTVYYRGGTLLSFNVDGCDSETVAAYLNENGVCVRAGFHCAPLAHKKLGTESVGAVRVSPGPFNTERDIDRVIRLIANKC